MLESVRKLGLICMGCGFGLMLSFTPTIDDLELMQVLEVRALAPYVLIFSGALLAHTYTHEEKLELAEKRSLNIKLLNRRFGQSKLNLIVNVGWGILGLGSALWLYHNYSDDYLLKFSSFLVFLIGYSIVYTFADHSKKIKFPKK